MNKGGPSFALLMVVVLGLLVCGIWYLGTGSTSASPSERVCTQDAMQCPDGSYVGRSGPDCTFTCPPAANALPSAPSGGGVTSSMPDAMSGSGEGESAAQNCTVPQMPPTICAKGSWSFIPGGGSADGVCNGSWECMVGL